MYTPMVTVRNFSSSSQAAELAQHDLAEHQLAGGGARAGGGGSNHLPRARGMNRKYSTENSTTPTWNLGISSVNRVASPYRDMDSTKIMSF